MRGFVIRKLIVRSDARALVGPIDLDVMPGRPFTILGETGAGKSLVAQTILGALPAGLFTSGHIAFDGTDLGGLTRSQKSAMWGRRIVMLPQEPWHALDPTMRAGAQVAETYRLVAGRTDARSAAGEALGALDVRGAEHLYPHELSGGMAQRVAFAAAMAGGAQAVVADEPTKGLDTALRDRAATLLASVTDTGGLLLTITHDVALARKLGGDVLLLRNGQAVEFGPAERVLTAPTSVYGQALVAAEPGDWFKRAVPKHAGSKQGERLVTVRNVEIARGGRALLEGVDLDLRAGERIAITGNSGVGKTSLLDAIAGLLQPYRGTIERADHLHGTSVQKLYQDPPSAFPAKVPLATALRDVERLHGLPPARMSGLLDRLGIDRSILRRLPTQVSGGELQRIALTRILALEPPVLLADEPTSRLDLITQKRLMDLLGELADERGIGVILVTHNPDIAARWADRSLALTAAT